MMMEMMEMRACLRTFQIRAKCGFLLGLASYSWKRISLLRNFCYCNKSTPAPATISWAHPQHIQHRQKHQRLLISLSSVLIGTLPGANRKEEVEGTLCEDPVTICGHQKLLQINPVHPPSSSSISSSSSSSFLATNIIRINYEYNSWYLWQISGLSIFRAKNFWFTKCKAEKVAFES